MSGLLPEGFHDRLPPAADAAARLRRQWVLGAKLGELAGSLRYRTVYL